MSENINTILKERCYDEVIEEFNNITLRELKSLVTLSIDTQKRIDGLIISRAETKFENLPEIQSKD